MRVKATKKGFYLCERAPGDVFDIPDNLLKKNGDKVLPPSWAVAHAEQKPHGKKGDTSGDANESLT